MKSGSQTMHFYPYLKCNIEKSSGAALRQLCLVVLLALVRFVLSTFPMPY